MAVPIIFFIVGGLFGSHILTMILKNKNTPKFSVGLHGVLILVGYIIVLVAEFGKSEPSLTASGIVLTVTIILGIILFYIDNIRKKLPPKLLAVIHPFLATISIILLLIYAAGY